MAPGYEQIDENGVSLVMRLLKSLYGLRQSPTNWRNTIDKHLVEIGFKSLKSDHCVYTYSECGAIYILTLYVDDVLLLVKDVLVLRRIKQKTAYEMLRSLVGSEMCIRDRVYKVKADNSHNGRVVALGWGQLPALIAAARLPPSAGSRASVWCWQ